VAHNLRRIEEAAGFSDCSAVAELRGREPDADAAYRTVMRELRQPFHLFLRRVVMAAHCQVTGAEPGFGHSISHSHRRNKRRFDPNIQKKRYWVPSLRRNVTLQVSAKGIKTIDVRGIDVVVATILARGVKL
jgi:large subunit ribosomal protein L28